MTIRASCGNSQKFAPMSSGGRILVGLDTLEDADKWVGSCEGRLASPLTDDELQGNGFSVLAGLEVFGPEAQADALADLKPTPHN